MRELVLVLVVAAGCTTMPPGEREAMEWRFAEHYLELLEEAWRMTATKRAIKAFDEARGR